MEMFTPSLDWGSEIVASVIWVAKAWAISASSTLLVLTLIARFTTWGRQYWRITGGYFTGRQSIPVWALLGVLLFSVLFSVRMDVLLRQRSVLRASGGVRECEFRQRRGAGFRHQWLLVLNCRLQPAGRHLSRPNPA